MNIRKKTLIIHPIMFAIYPLLSLYTANRDIVRFESVLRDSLIVVFITTLAWIGLALLLHNSLKASVHVSAFLFFFLSFRHLIIGVGALSYIIGFSSNALKLINTNAALLVWLLIFALLFGVIAYRVQKERWNLATMSEILNVFSSALVLIILISSYLIPFTTSLMRSQQATSNFDSDWAARINSETCAVSNSSGQLPDVYYIVLDGYARDDVLMDIYQVDNSEFLSFLEQKGFYVARDARANYKRTSLALSSYLNFNYLDQLADDIGLAAIAEKHLSTVIANNRTFHQLRCLGYKIVSFETGFYYTHIPTADVVYSQERTPSSFENIFIGNTLLMIWMRDQQYNWHREGILYTLSKLPEIAGSNSPKFVFVHVLSPHPPFVFGPNGEPKNPQWEFTLNDGNGFKILASESEYIQRYGEQVTYLSKLVMSAIQGILDNSVQPPVIIVQGDHGPALHYDDNLLEKTDVKERFSILNAYYLPGVQEEKILYSKITPVNTFRIIFNTYFGTDYPLLEDKSFYCPDYNIYEFIDITNKIPDNQRK